MSCLVNNANPVIFTFNFQPNNSPNDKRTPMSSILRDVSPNMLFSFLPLYIRTIFFPCEEVGDQIKLRKQSRIKKCPSLKNRRQSKDAVIPSAR